MQRYWTKIGLGAGVVFIVGMVFITMFRNGIHQFEAMTSSDRPIGIPLALLPFRVEGDRLGTVRRLELLRSTPKRVTGIRLTVKLQDSTALGHLEDCTLTIREPAVFGGRDGFGCSSATDSASERLERIGEIVIEPSGAVRAILAPAADVAEWRASLYDTAAAQAELAALKSEQLADSAARAVVVQADSTHAIIDIRGDSARSLLQLRADSHGAVLRVRSRSGNQILRMHADSTGASLTIGSDSSSPRHKR